MVVSNAHTNIRVTSTDSQPENTGPSIGRPVKIFVEAHGCTQNYGEARLMQEALAGQGHALVTTEGDADAHVLVTCTVVETTERNMLRRMTELAAYPVDTIIEQVRRSVDRGMKEIKLTGQDTGAYGLDAGTNLAALLRAVDGLAGKFRVRVGMADPLTVYPIVDELVEAYGSEKIFKFLHLPVQSGDDAILEAMRREYNVAQFEDIVHTFRRAYPRITLSTDVIVGFPGEDDDQFGKTMELIERIRPDIVNVTRFSPRVGTPAARMPNPIVGWRVKERSRQLTWMRFEIAQQIHEAFVGEEVEVLLTEPGKESTVLARTPEYRQVVLPGPLPLGAFARVRIEAARATDLRGTLLGVPTEFPQSSSAA